MPPAESKLDLGSLRSYSPSWPFSVRLTLAIAVQYACFRCVERVEAIHRQLNPAVDNGGGGGGGGNGNDDNIDDDLVERDDDGNVKAKLHGWERRQRIRRDGDLVVAWQEYTEKFVMATCQHLGIAPETLPRTCWL